MRYQRHLAIMLALTAGLPCLCQHLIPPAADGYITHIASPSEFDINGFHVSVEPRTKIKLQKADATSFVAIDQAKPYVGEAAKVYGKLNEKSHTVTANLIELTGFEPREITGSGIVDAVLPTASTDAATDRLVRADGYPVLLDAKSSIKYDQPLSAGTALTTNLWITFKGIQGPDGVIVADEVQISPNIVGHREDKVRTKHEYDPESVDADAHQSGMSRTFLGIDPEKIPPSPDTAMQARVSEIGQRLVPKYQRDLPDTDPTRIDFRFQVVNEKKWEDAYTLANGIILVPHHIVERMQNDSQLATILADNIAAALEKQTLHAQPPNQTLGATNIAGAVGGAFVPGLGLLTDVATGGVGYKLALLRLEQSGRVGLGLLHDAGYDVEQAPLAWWVLAAKKDKDLAGTKMPRRTAYLYKMLGTTWHTP